MEVSPAPVPDGAADDKHSIASLSHFNVRKACCFTNHKHKKSKHTMSDRLYIFDTTLRDGRL